MRLWSLHPKYLDAQGLVALWRESLLAQAVLYGQTKGYRGHPQLVRFINAPDTVSAISCYLRAIHAEAEQRGYTFNKNKIYPAQQELQLEITDGQLEYEWSHLMQKLTIRCPVLYQQWKTVSTPDPHPLFIVCKGEIATWERVKT